MQIMATCNSCHQDYNMTENMEQREVTLDEKLMLTVLVCPNCGNEVVSQVDNNATLQLQHHNLLMLKQIGERQYRYGNATETQLRKQSQVNDKLFRVRADLCGKYNHTSYQFDGKEHKLDIHIPSMSISEG